MSFAKTILAFLAVILATFSARAEMYRAECLISYRALEECAPFTGCDFGANVVWFSFSDDGVDMSGIHPQWSEKPEESFKNIYFAVRNEMVEKVRDEREEQNRYIFNHVKSYKLLKEQD